MKKMLLKQIITSNKLETLIFENLFYYVFLFSRNKTEKNLSRKGGCEADRWKHDRFDPDQQLPKSTRDIIRIYGYDIRKDLNAQIKAKNDEANKM